MNSSRHHLSGIVAIKKGKRFCRTSGTMFRLGRLWSLMVEIAMRKDHETSCAPADGQVRVAPLLLARGSVGGRSCRACLTLTRMGSNSSFMPRSARLDAPGVLHHVRRGRQGRNVGAKTHYFLHFRTNFSLLSTLSITSCFCTHVLFIFTST
jgi:hypothetical protein